MVAGMKRALKLAGVPMPGLNPRIWQWIKDNGSQSAVQVANALSEPAGDMSSRLGMMYNRGMLLRKEEHKPGTNSKYYSYSAPAKMKVYELLPFTEEGKKRIAEHRHALKKEQTKEPSGMVVAGTAHLPPPVVQPIEPAPQASVEDEIETLLGRMSVAHGFKLFIRLREMFVDHKFSA